MKLEFSLQKFEKFSTIKFHKNLFSDSRVVTCGYREVGADITKLIVAFRNSESAL